MKQTISWFITSSQNPENYSLFIKSIATFAALFGFDAAVVNEAGSQIGSLIVGIGMIASAITSLWGIVRKVKLGRWSAAPSDFYSQEG